MKETVRKDPYSKKKNSPIMWALRLFLLFVVAIACATASFLMYARWLGAANPAVLGSGASHLNPVERVVLQARLASQAEALGQPIGSGAPAEFVIEPGQSATSIAANLEQSGLLSDSELFVTYLRYYGLDSQLEAGAYRIEPAWTIPELALGLTESYGQEVAMRFLEGWRLEEMAAYLSTVNAARIDGARFLEIAQRREAFDLSPYPAVQQALPAGATLEGFLFPDTYRVPLDAEAPLLVAMMLQNFEERVAADLSAAFGANGLSLFEAVTLASIVEREAPLAGERPHVAAVFYNRLAQGMLLQADPTVQYAVGFDEVSNSWWKSGLTQADLQLPSPYNTYLHDGLPPGPIANPGLESLQAVAFPLQSNDLFFVADCGGQSGQPGAHLFSETYEEHLVNVQQCRQE